MLEKKNVLITGASSGIGEELAKVFAKEGYNLVLVARIADKLKALAKSLTSEHNVKVWVAPADLSLLGTGLTTMAAHFATDMIERGFGRMLNVASIAAFQPIPSLATYAATKAYVLSFTESLSEEFKGTGVTITALCPGVAETNMFAGAKAASSQLEKLPKFLVGDVGAVAREGFDACMRGDVICVPGAINQATIIAGRATPKWLLRKVSGAFVRGMK
jgi:uncharacterized protein